ncbi:MAG: VOC family protein [Planctomycetota bacterium]|nr:VOC family protein [Planctomycetota bacterium]
MSDYNSAKNRAVWFDVPVAKLDRAIAFYAAMLAVKISKEKFGEMEFAVLEHNDGNGACLIVEPASIASDRGLLVYFNVDGRIRAAVAAAEKLGGKVTKPIHAIGPHGFRAVLVDSEGNRIALHSQKDM